MDLIFITTPIRPIPTQFPPIGALSILSYLKRRNIVNNFDFYHIDANRPSFEDAVSYIVQRKPKVLAISSVVSTAYEYSKKISIAVKKALPETLIVLGGNLAASAQIILERTGVDICVTGEGERTFAEIMERAKTTTNPIDYRDILGVAFIDENKEFYMSPYPMALSKTEIYDIDWEILEKSTDINIYFGKVKFGEGSWMKYSHDPRASELKRQGKTYAQVPSAKGCVARCTFCHRFEKGIRYIPMDEWEIRLNNWIKKYDLGFIDISDENFGTDQRWLLAFCETIKKYDVLWRVEGMRVNSISDENIKIMKDAGCVSCVFGMETGSAKMLAVMEKKVKLEDNYNAMDLIVKNGLETTIQLVVGMPGEDPYTIRDTIKFTSKSLSLSKLQNPHHLSINYAQALPGTALYEYGRHKKLIGSGMDGEEEYLIKISDKDAHDEVSTLNFTDYPKLVTETWRPLISICTNYAYVKKFGIEHYLNLTFKKEKEKKVTSVAESIPDEGYFANPKRLYDTSTITSTVNEVDEDQISLSEMTEVPSLIDLVRENKLGIAVFLFPRLFYNLRFMLVFFLIYKNFRRNGFKYTLGLINEYLKFILKLEFIWPKSIEVKSLRKIMVDIGDDGADLEGVRKLRLGR